MQRETQARLDDWDCKSSVQIHNNPQTTFFGARNLVAGALATLIVLAGTHDARAVCLSVPGDLNGNNVTNVVDVQCSILVSLWVLNGMVEAAPGCLLGGLENADTNCNGEINVVDVQIVSQYSLGLPLSAEIDANQNGCPDQCEAEFCGNGVCAADGSETCVSCAGDCGACTGACCEPHGGLGCEDAGITACVCATDSFCCEVAWDDICAGEVESLGCGECAAPPGDCCVIGEGAGCNNDACATCVCANDAFCCDVQWDGLCVGAATTTCQNECGCAAPASCCETHDTPGCDNADCQNCVCGLDPFCCDTSWDSICVGEAQIDCAATCSCPITSDCCTTSGDLPGCGPGNIDCEGCVCALDPFCCDTAWDGLCVEAANGPDCGTACGCVTPNTCLDFGVDPACCDTICAVDPFCCETSFDSICQDELSLCAPPNPCIEFGVDPACCDTICAVDPFCCETAFDATCEGELSLCEAPLCPASDNDCFSASNNCDATFGDSCYTLGQTADGSTADWFAAQAECAAAGGHLAVISSVEENAAVASLVPMCGSGRAWIGLSDNTTEGSFEWINGEPVSFTNWGPGEPNQQGDEDFTEIFPDGSWNDLAQFDPFASACWVCEIPPAAGGPGCNDVACCETVCAVDAFCCETSWDSICANEATELCAPSNPCLDFGVDPACCDTICAVDPFCCETAFDLTCEGALSLCAPPNPCLEFGVSAACCATICAVDPFCCETSFDGICQDELSLCGNTTCCETGSDTPGCGDPNCEACVCAADPFCCDTAWDGFCVGAANDPALCGTACNCVAESCGNGICAPGEDCTNCPDDCGPCSNPCIDFGVSQACCDTICAVDPFCCDVGFDSICQDELSLCGNTTCCETGSDTPGCGDPNCEACVCALDPFCCETSWDGLCISEANDPVLCGSQCGCASPEACGDGICAPGEECGGPAACSADCGGCTCQATLDCVLQCPADDPACAPACLSQVSADEQPQAQALVDCALASGCAPGSPDLLACLADNCSDTLLQCLGQPPTGPQCIDGVNCALSCFGDAACIATCFGATAPDQTAAAEALYACVIASGCMVPGQDITACVNAACPTEVAACLPPIGPGPTCVDTVNCSLQCGLTPECVDGCSTQTDPAELGEALALIDCLLANNCHTATSQAEFDACLQGFCLVEAETCLTPSTSCGDGVCAPGEDCANCPTDCGPCSNPCLDFGVSQACCDTICAVDSFCCTTSFDSICQQEQIDLCGNTTCCETGSDIPGCGDPDCEACVCALDPFCCETSWDGLCITEANNECLAACNCPPAPEICGNGFCGTGEDCANCPDDCGPCSNPCLDFGVSQACCDTICAVDSFCCTTSFDGLCQQEQIDLCGNTTCCETGSDTPGCGDPNCEACVCALDPFCCETSWDGLCITEANNECLAACNCPPAPEICGNGFCGTGEDCANCPDDCGPCSNPCLDFGVSQACCDTICAVDSFCCTTSFDGLCQQEQIDLCGNTTCCETGSDIPGCGDPNCEACVCALDPFCCETSWDGLCITEANNECLAACNCPPAPEICGNGFCGTGEDCANCPDDCGPCSNPCLDFGVSQACCDTICAVDAFCCTTSFDGLCQQEQIDLCGNTTCCETGSDIPGCGDPNCEACVCALDPFCCETSWDGLCITEANNECLAACNCPPAPEICGNGTCGTGEDCANCPDDCGPCSNPCLDFGVSQACCDTICAVDPFCCEAGFDGLCQQEQIDLCGNTTCCETGSDTPGCGDPNCEACVCALDPFCCETSWDGLCITEANNECLAACNCPPAPEICGNGTCGTGEDCANCPDDCGPCSNPCLDFGVDPACCDTICAVDPFCCQTAFDLTCEGELSLCVPPNPCLDFGVSQACCDTICAVDSFCCTTSFDSICQQEQIDLCGNTTCCETVSGTPGCGDPNCEACVCGLDPFCCETSWDGLCIQEANNECLAACNCPPAPEICGNGTCGTGEDCTNCPDDCGPCPNSCIEFGLDPACCDAICAVDPFCCETAFDLTCEGELSLCEVAPLCPASDNDCFSASSNCDATFGNSCYTLGQTADGSTADWFAAQAECAAAGGHLAVISSAEENAAVASLVPMCGSGRAWIGLSDSTTEGSFEWINGEPVSFTNWGPGEPNQQGDEDFTEIFPDGSWNDLAQFDPFASACWVCEIPPAAGGPGCNDVACCETVCAVDAFCCETSWDGICANEATELCAPPNNPCLDFGVDQACCDTICAVDAFCCDTSFDSICQQEQIDLCGGGPEFCGNGICAPGEDCANCPNDCGPCSNPCLDFGVDQACCDTICAVDAFCCTTSFDGICQQEQIDLCGGGEFCGNGICAPGEDCANCPEDCGPCSNPCLDFGVDQACCDTICAVDPFCCETSFDGICQQEQIDLCGNTTCCETVSGTPGCGDPNCEACVCALDPFCCETSWDGLCVQEANNECLAACNCPPAPEICGNGTCGTGEDCANCPGDCGPCSNPCLDFGVDAACCDTICAVDPFCCETSFDGICQQEQIDLCGGVPEVCGNLICAPGEDCANCPADCGPCPNPCLDFGVDPACCDTICAVDAFCCENSFDAQCESELSLCAPPNPCLDFGVSQTCCDTICAVDAFCCETSFDGICQQEQIDLCGGIGSPICCQTGSDAPGCGDANCEACICAFDSFCCNTSWDGICVNEANNQCVFECGCSLVTEFCGNGTCGTGEDCANCPEDCGPCSNPCLDFGVDPACCDTICTVDAFCCENSFDGICQQEQIDLCGGVPEVCGNLICAPGEDCTNCPADCGPCPNPCLDFGVDPACCDTICAVDAFCCTTSFDGICQQEQIDLCGGGEFCGNGICAPGEDCTNCPEDCGPCPNPCLDFGVSQTCCDTICAVDAFCCETSFDSICQQEQIDLCGGIGSPVCCQTGNDVPGCGDGNCEACVCALDSFCCNTSWDTICVGEANNECLVECGCGQVTEFCGNGTCGTGEDCANCPGDCGPCTNTCLDFGVDPACCDTICAVDAFCCDTSFDSICQQEQIDLCGGGGGEFCGNGLCAPGEDCTNCPGDCGSCSNTCVDVGIDPTCCSAICAADLFCCEVEFDFICQDELLQFCP